MGYGSWSDDAYSRLSRERSTKRKEEVFTETRTHTNMSPKGVIREARDSVEHPNSVPVIFAFDVTGSMDTIPEAFAKGLLAPLMNNIIHKGIADPQILFAAVGDHLADRSPLQVGQFESANAQLDTWLTKIHLEGGGGTWGKESYHLPWLFAARQTKLDCWEKRRQKGYLITVGDEHVHDELDANSMKKIFGGQGENLSTRDMLREAQEMYNVYHIHVNHGATSRDAGVISTWKELLGQNLIILNDYTQIASTTADLVTSTQKLLTA